MVEDGITWSYMGSLPKNQECFSYPDIFSLFKLFIFYLYSFSPQEPLRCFVLPPERDRTQLPLGKTTSLGVCKAERQTRTPVSAGTRKGDACTS